MSTKLFKYYLDKYIYLIPIIMLIVTLYSNFYEINYTIAGNLIGYSLLTNILMWFLFNKGNYCWFTKNIPLALIFINIVDILGAFINYDFYAKIFNTTVCFISLFMFLMFKIKTMLK